MIAIIEDVLAWQAVDERSDAAPPTPVLELRGVSFGYTAGRPVLQDVDLVVEPGEFVAVAGPNGGGKTTLLRLALGLEQPMRGTALLLGEPATRCSRRAEVGYVAQRTQLGGEAPATVREVVAAGRLAGGTLLGPLRRGDRELVDHAIARVGLADRARSPLRTLSGGMQQRAFIAKALAAQPSLLVLDEPTTGVDAASQESLAALLDGLRRELGATIVYVSHEFGAVERFVERIVLVRGGIVFDGHPDALPGVWHDPSHVHV
jgi:zinc transport system ATP-binding protein